MTSDDIREQVQSATKTIAKKDTVEGQTLGVMLSIFGQLATLNVQLSEINAKTPTLRDQIAMQFSVEEARACTQNNIPMDAEKHAKWCFKMSDAMLKAREGKL